MQKRDIKYINRDFSSFKQSLIDFSKSYFPNTYNDFNDDADPGNMFIELVSYIGDVLSFYTDKQIQEIFPQFATDLNNIMAMAYTFGYRPKVSSTSTVDLDVYQLVPSKIEANVASPDFNYTVVVNKESKIKSTSKSDVVFITQDLVDFSFSSSYDPVEISVYEINGSNQQPEYYLFKKKVKAIAGTIKSTQFAFNTPEKFTSVTLPDDDIIQILDVVDSDGNKWYEVPYLSQNLIYEEIKNNTINDPYFASENNKVPYMLKARKEQRRFTARFNSNLKMELEFGSGILSNPDELIIPNPDNVGMGLIDSISKLNTAFDPVNFLYTNEYGLAPSNTTLTVRYLIGGGAASNVPSNDVTSNYELVVTSTSVNPNALSQPLLQYCINSVAFNNETPATGGGDGDSVDDIRIRTMSSFATQLRTVTTDDYIIRAMSLPAKFGSIAKVYISQESGNTDDFISGNPLSLNMYILSYDEFKRLENSSLALKENLRTYINQYKMENDGITIRDAYVVNIGINFDIVVSPSFNSREVLVQCLNEMKKFFNIDNYQINQPIIIAEIYKILSSINGVQNVIKVDIVNKQGLDKGYSRWGYDTVGAIKNNILYPSKDPCIFEVKYPDNDIKGRVVNI